MLELQNVNKFYTTNGVTNLGLRNINLKFNLGEVVAITGDSGSGKSTLLNVIAKIDTFDEGEIYYKGNETSYFSIKDMDDFRKNKIGFVFQNYNIIESYTVLENVMVPLYLKGMATKDAKKKALELIKKVGLEGKERNRGTKLSGGEKQRCVIARALASECEILICDEPTGNLDSQTSKEIISLIKEAAKDKLVLIVTHNFEDFKDIVTRKITISDGEILEDVTFLETPKDEDVNLNLDYVPLEKKIDLKIAKNNILFTPRKSLFLLIIFMVIFFFTLYFFQSINLSYKNIYHDSGYRNRQSNRVYLYNDNKTPLDVDKVKQVCDKVIIHSYYEEKSIDIYSTNYEELIARGFYNQYIENYKILEGKLPKENDELFIVLPKNANDRFISSSRDIEGYLGQELLVSGLYYSKDISKSFKLCGYGESSEITQCVFFGNKETETYIRRGLMNIFVEGKITTLLKTEVIPFSLTINNEINHSFSVHIPKDIDINQFSIEISYGIYPINDYEIVYDDLITKPFCYYSPEIFDQNCVFEMSAYASNTKYLQKEIENLGYSCDIVKTHDNTKGIEVILLNIGKYFTMIGFSILLFFIFFITYFVLAKVYASKKKDYQILRTLGVTKKDMSRIVKYEVMMLAAVAWLAALIGYIIVANNVASMNAVASVDFMTLILYLLVSIIFAYAISRRFNRRLFKFSVTKSLKEGE